MIDCHLSTAACGIQKRREEKRREEKRKEGTKEVYMLRGTAISCDQR